MTDKCGTSKDAADNLVRGIKRKTRKQQTAEEKIRIALAKAVKDFDAQSLISGPYIDAFAVSVSQSEHGTL